jgi:hypothetical protein
MRLKTVCGSPVLLAVCVSGDRFFDPDNSSDFYFRMVEIEKILVRGGTPSDMLMYVSLSKAAKNINFSNIGIDPQENSALRWAYMQPHMKDSGAKHTKIGIALLKSSEGDSIPFDCCAESVATDIKETCLGGQEFVHNVKEMPVSTEPEPWDNYRVYKNGRNGRAASQGCIKFGYRGNQYWLPAEYYEDVLKACDSGNNKHAVMLVINDPNNSDFNCTRPDNPTPPKKMERLSAKNLPVQTNPMLIVGGGLVSARMENKQTYIDIQNDGKFGRYNLPFSICEQLKIIFKERNCVDGAWLIGYKISHPQKQTARVEGGKSRSEEEVIKIMDTNNKIVAQSVLKSEKKRLMDSRQTDEQQTRMPKRKRAHK